jgi:hypothetical protein
MMSQNWMVHKHKITLGPPNNAPSYFSPFQPLLNNQPLREHPQLYGLPSPNHIVQCRLYSHGMWLAREPGAGSGERGAGKKGVGSRDCRKKS